MKQIQRNSSFGFLKMLVLIFFQVLIIKIAVSDCSLLVIKCFGEVVYQPIFYERKSVQF